MAVGSRLGKRMESNDSRRLKQNGKRLLTEKPVVLDNAFFGLTKRTSEDKPPLTLRTIRFNALL